MSLSVTLADPLEAMVYGPSARTLRVGLVIPRSGVMGLVGPSALEAALLAAQEVNRAAGPDGRPVELVVADSGGDPSQVARTVSDLAASGAVEAFVGLHTSRTLLHVERALDGRLPYVFTAGFEATRTRPAVYCPGETPEQFAVSLGRVIRERGVRDWAILGTDYVWPRAMRVAQLLAVPRYDGRVVLDRTLPLGRAGEVADVVLDELLSSGAGGVVLNTPGRDQVVLLKALRRRGLDRKLVRVSGCLEENTLYAINGDGSGNLYASSHSFDTLASPKRLDLEDRYRSAVGEEAPVLNAWAEHCYDSVHYLARCDARGLLTAEAFTTQVTAEAGSSEAAPRPEYDMHLAVAEGLSFTVL
ncbi:ABC transporter substrate-binding protein [Streptomyces sp. NPDC059255]|uniref:ABC transporter substrate-binding protein n=1 Tax=Streptomyces sp. NPDC059255 TaxID=3346793 RepID=UPI0036A809E9